MSDSEKNKKAGKTNIVSKAGFVLLGLVLGVVYGVVTGQWGKGEYIGIVCAISFACFVKKLK